MEITHEQSQKYLDSFDDFLINSAAFIANWETNIENFFKNQFYHWSYNSLTVNFFIEEIVSFDSLVILVIFFILLYFILRIRH